MEFPWLGLRFSSVEVISGAGFESVIMSVPESDFRFVDEDDLLRRAPPVGSVGFAPILNIVPSPRNNFEFRFFFFEGVSRSLLLRRIMTSGSLSRCPGSGLPKQSSSSGSRSSIAKSLLPSSGKSFS